MARAYRPSIIRTCIVCGTPFKRFASQLRTPREGLFCSRACKVMGQNRRPALISLTNCEECGEQFSYTKQSAKRKTDTGLPKYCSRECAGKWRSKNIFGENHPCWKGGISERSHASRIVIAQVKRVKPKCEGCGSAAGLQGHHIKSYTTHPEEAENPNNIKVLCIDCHAAEHPRLASFITHIPTRGKLNSGYFSWQN